MTRANPNLPESESQTVASLGPYTSSVVEPAVQPPTPLLDPREAEKPWPLNPFQNPYLWHASTSEEIPKPPRPQLRWGQIDEEVEFPNRFTFPSNSSDPNLPKSLGCITYDSPTSPSSPERVGLFSTNPINAFPNTYKALAKLFLNHCKLQKHASVTIDATERQTLLASSPFVTLRRYASAIEKETEKLKDFAESTYREALSEWESREQQKLQRKKSVKGAKSSGGKHINTKDQKLAAMQDLSEIEEAIMSFRKQQKHRQSCIIAVDQLGQAALIIDSFQLWDALRHRGLLSEEQVTEEEVKGVYLVWKKVPRGAIVRCEPIIDKEEVESGMAEEDNDKPRFVKKPTARKIRQETNSSDDVSISISAPRKHSRLKVPSIKRRSLRSTPIGPETGHQKRQRLKSKNTPSIPIKKVSTTANSAKKQHLKHKASIFAVADILSHGWGLWTKSRGIYFRHRKGRLHREYLVRWAGINYEDTWEPEPNLGSDCLDYYWETQGTPRPDAPPLGYDLTVF